MKVALPIPPAPVAVIVEVYVPGVERIPEMIPVDVLTFRPLGNPVAP